MSINLFIDTALEKLEKRIIEVIPNKTPETIYEPFRYVMSGEGKRIRPLLTLLSAGACGAEPFEALDYAVAIEILHNFTLVHDDIMDKSEKRRGRPTVHIKWNEPSAIISGDAMIGYALKLLLPAKKHKRSLEICTMFNNGLIDVCEGQGFDMEFNSNQNVSMEEYFEMIAKKTSSLLQTAALLGAHYAEADDNALNSINSFAYHLGLAFQIQDDLLDMTANEKLLGKKVGLDIAEGKKTCLILYANQKATDANHKALLNEYYNNNGLPFSRVPEFDKMFKELGIYQIAEDEAQNRFSLAKSAISELPISEYSELLIELTDIINKRVK